MMKVLGDNLLLGIVSHEAEITPLQTLAERKWVTGHANLRYLNKLLCGFARQASRRVFFHTPAGRKVNNRRRKKN